MTPLPAGAQPAILAAEMHTDCGSNKARGIVISDLHLFARRSRGADCVAALSPELAASQVLVLNGDIFDFCWSTLRDVQSTVTAALEWLEHLLKTFPQCRVHYILGNHDYLQSFRDGITELASEEPRLRFHEQGVRIGNAMFLHGDCTHRKMDPARLRRYREYWDSHRQHGVLRARAYMAVDQLGITRFTQARWFPRKQTVERLVHYLDRASPGWRPKVRDCYFGHTHLPFSNYRHKGVNFHNTGSAIRGMGFNPIIFSADVERNETLTSRK